MAAGADFSPPSRKTTQSACDRYEIPGKPGWLPSARFMRPGMVRR